MITLVVGDVEPEATLKKVEKAFANNNKVSKQKHYQQENRLTKMMLTVIQEPARF